MFYTHHLTNSTLVLVNVTLSNNVAGAGGGLFLSDYARVSITCPDASQSGDHACCMLGCCCFITLTVLLKHTSKHVSQVIKLL